MKEQNTKTEFTKMLNAELNKLRCESHPKVCEMRDLNIGRLRRLITAEILSDKYTEPPSIQSAIAALETEL